MGGGLGEGLLGGGGAELEPEGLPPTAGLQEPLGLEHIEDRGVSAAFLAHLTAKRLTAEMADGATEGAISSFLEGAVARGEHGLRALVDGNGDPLVEPAALASAERAQKLLQADLDRRRAAPYLTSRDVHRLLVVAETSASMCRYVELPAVRDGVDPDSQMRWVGRAQHFFSYSWDSPWDDVVGALVDHTARVVAGGEPPPYYWVDIFAVNQHLAIPPWRCTSGVGPGCPGCAAVAADMHDWATADPNRPKGFERVIGATRHTLVLMEPWDSPRPPTRVWCLFEQYTTLAKNGRLEVVLGRQQQRDLQRSLDLRFEAVAAAVRNIDARLADATVAADKEAIFSAIEGLPGGFEGLNRAAQQAQQQWLAAAAAGVVQRTDPNRPPLEAAELTLDVAGLSAAERKGPMEGCLPTGDLLATLARLERQPRLPQALLIGALVWQVLCTIGIGVSRAAGAGDIGMVVPILAGLAFASWSYVLSSLQAEYQLRRPPLWPWPWLQQASDPMVGGLGGWAIPLSTSLLQLVGPLNYVVLVLAFVLLFPMLGARRTAATRARLATKAGWLQYQSASEGGDTSAAAATAVELFEKIEEELQEVVGRHDVQYSHLASAFRVKVLQAVGRSQEASALVGAVDSVAAMHKRGTRRWWLHRLCSCRGRMNCCMSSTAVGASFTVTDGARFGKTTEADWTALRATMHCANGAPDETVLELLTKAAEEGCPRTAHERTCFVSGDGFEEQIDGMTMMLRGGVERRQARPEWEGFVARMEETDLAQGAVPAAEHDQAAWRTYCEATDKNRSAEFRAEQTRAMLFVAVAVGSWLVAGLFIDAMAPHRPHGNATNATNMTQ